VCRSRHDRFNSSAAFSLVELLIVATLLIVLGTMGMAGMSTTRRGYSLYTASFTIASKLQDARTNALKRNRQAWLLLDPDARRLQVQIAGSGGVAIDVGGPQYLDRTITFDGMAGTARVTFDALGRPLNPPQVIQFHQGATGSPWRRTITVASTGRITVQ
jgi:Tfp pilus assembly protein FimT